jgi:hypothetical protein
MSSNLSTIGFHFEDEDAFASAVERLAGDAVERISCPIGEYAVWRSRTGAELWFHLAPPEDGAEERVIVGMTPFFEGESEVELKLTGRLSRQDDNPFEGAWQAWVAPDETGEGNYPIIFDAVDHAVQILRPLPALVSARVCGFARDLKAYPSLEAFYAVEDRDIPIADKAFIPLGLFADVASDDGDAWEDARETGQCLPASSIGLLTGEVLDHRVLTNEDSGGTFHWMRIESLDATYDVLADPEIVTGELAPGHIVMAACWFVGRLI